MSPIIVSLFDAHPCLNSVAEHLNAELADIKLRFFPDGETYIKFKTNLEGRDVIFLNSLDKPNNKFLSLLLACETARELGAKSVGICAPYLSYMRQDKQFTPGEGITSKYFAKLLSQHFDWLVTVDPHLHRYNKLSEIYTIPTKTLHAAELISDWIAKEISNPVLIGPDSESDQWVSEIASKNNLPFLILAKERFDDYHVSISMPDLEKYESHQPVLIDDIISTGKTILETIKHINQLNLIDPICIGVHAIFANNAYEQLQQAKTKQIITCNTIEHSSNLIDLSELLADGIAALLVNSMHDNEVDKI